MTSFPVTVDHTGLITPEMFAAVTDSDAKPTKELSQSIRDAQAVLVRSDPFHASMLMDMAVIEDNSMPTAATDCYKKIWVNAGFMGMLSPKQGAFVVAHEISHKILMHAARAKNLQDFNAMLWNLAGDFIINKALLDYGYPVDEIAQRMGARTVQNTVDMIASLGKEPDPKNPIQDGICFDQTLDSTETTESLYNKFLQEAQNNPELQKLGQAVAAAMLNEGGEGDGKGGEGDGKGGNPMAGDVKGDDYSDTCKEEGVSDAQASADIQASIMAAAQNAAARGNMPGYLQGMIDQMTEPYVDWRSALRRFCRSQARDDFSYRRVSRRTSNDSRIIRPGMYSETPQLFVYIVDESGSVPDAYLQQFLGEVTSIHRRLKPAKVLVLMCDTRVTSAKTYKAHENIQFTTGGRGGTDMTPAFEHIRDNNLRPDAVICMTDGEMLWPDRNIAPFPTFFAICNDRGHFDADAVEWGTYVEIKVNN